MGNTITFDTLALADRLEKSGFTAEQAKGAAHALSNALSEGTVTPQYLDLRFAELKADVLKWMFTGMAAQAGIIVTLQKLL